MKLKELDLLKVGNTIQMAGAVFAGEGEVYLVMFPDEHGHDTKAIVTLELDTTEWTAFLRQTDLLEVEILAKASDGTLAKAIVRKSQRQIDAAVSWRVFRRDEYRCRYCGRNDVPLTVDHLVRWEEGGPSIEANLLSACKKDNRTRGDMSYAQWLRSTHYKDLSKNLADHFRVDNEALLGTLDKIPRRVHVHSRGS